MRFRKLAARMFGALAASLRRLADLVRIGATAISPSPTPAVDHADLEDQPVSPPAPGTSSDSASSGPPAHWLERVRRDWPQLLEAGGFRTYVIRAPRQHSPGADASSTAPQVESSARSAPPLLGLHLVPGPRRSATERRTQYSAVVRAAAIARASPAPPPGATKRRLTVPSPQGRAEPRHERVSEFEPVTTAKGHTFPRTPAPATSSARSRPDQHQERVYHRRSDAPVRRASAAAERDAPRERRSAPPPAAPPPGPPAAPSSRLPAAQPLLGSHRTATRHASKRAPSASRASQPEWPVVEYDLRKIPITRSADLQSARNVEPRASVAWPDTPPATVAWPDAPRAAPPMSPSIHDAWPRVWAQSAPLSPRRSPSTESIEQAERPVDRWPDLPRSAPTETHLEVALRAWERRQRLDDEQRGL